MTAWGKSNKHKIVNCLYIQICCPKESRSSAVAMCVCYETLRSSSVVHRFTAAWGPSLNKEACELKCLPDLSVPPATFLFISTFQEASQRNNTNQCCFLQKFWCDNYKLLHCTLTLFKNTNISWTEWTFSLLAPSLAEIGYWWHKTSVTFAVYKKNNSVKDEKKDILMYSRRTLQLYIH